MSYRYNIIPKSIQSELLLLFTFAIEMVFVFKFKRVIALVSLWVLCACNEVKEIRLPILGSPSVNGTDTVWPVIKPFSFTNQDGIVVSDSTFNNKIYVADFIFLSCPTICPKMNANLLDVYHTFEHDSSVLFISHTIDPEHDSRERLKQFSENINVSSWKWHFVRGNQDSVYTLAEHSYFSTAYKDSSAPGGYIHSGGFLLIDKQKHIRGVYDGTDDTEKNRLIDDIRILLKE